MAYEVQLDSFQGPLDLLYQLVKKHRIEISEISLARVTEQYLEYLKQMEVFNLDVASEFLVIAAELIQLKVKTLLPDSSGDEEEETNRESDLVRRLKEYHYFKKLSLLLQDYEEKAEKLFFREIDPDIIEESLELELNINIIELTDAYLNTMAAMTVKNKDVIDLLKQDKWNQMNFDEIEIEDKREYILEKLADNPDGFTFEELIVNPGNRLEIVVVFLGLLELAKLKKINLYQDKVFTSIHFK